MIVYDGDGNRVSETAGSVTTNYLVDTVNPTGYAQVVDELQGSAVSRTYSYGLERISETQTLNSNLTTSFYGYDGHGSVRQLTNPAGAITDSYDYDAFGNLINSTGSTPNVYLFAGEAYDPALGLYYNRARYYNQQTGRFWSMDTVEGNSRDPLSLHRYLYAAGNPVDMVDPSGHDYIDLVVSLGVSNVLSAMSTTLLNSPLGSSVGSFVASLLIPSDVLQALQNRLPNAVELGVNGQLSLNTRVPFGLNGSGGFELIGSLRTGNAALYSYVGAGISIGSTSSGGGVAGTFGLVWNCPSSYAYTQGFETITVPLSTLSQAIRTEIQTEITQVSFAAFLGDIPVGYATLLSAVSTSAVTGGLSADTAVNIFWGTGSSEVLGVSIGVSASGQSEGGPSKTSFWNVSGALSEYWQLWPGQNVPLE
jgi:RHS repeat-associated protein